MGGITGREVSGIFGYRTVIATIAKDASLSDGVDIGDARSLAFYIPATWDSAKLTFQAASTIDGTYQNLYHFDGTELTVPSQAQARVVGCPPTSLSMGACRFIKVRSGTAAAAVVQTAEKPIKILIKG